MKQLTNTFLYNHTKVNNFVSELKKIDFDKETVDIKDLEDNLKIINRRFVYSLKIQSLLSLEKNQTLLLFPENSLTKLIPVFLKGNNKAEGGVSAVINLRLYATRDKLGNYNINNRTLYGLLESAYIARQIHSKWSTFEYNTTIMKYSTIIYVKLMNKILDKKFGINLAPMQSDQINYVLGKFFLLNIIEKKEGDIVNNIAYSTIFNDTNKQNIIDCDSNFSNDAYTDLDIFFRNLRENFDILGNLNIRQFIMDWMTMFGEASLFAIEYYPIMLQSVFCGAVIGCNLTAKDSVFDNVVGREALKLHTEISKLLK